MLAPLLLQPMLRVSEGILYALGRRALHRHHRAGRDRRRPRAGVRADPEHGRGRRRDRQRRRDPRRRRARAWCSRSACTGPSSLAGRAAAARRRSSRCAVAGASWAVLLGRDAASAVAAGALAFFVAAFLLRPLSAEDAEWLSGALGRRRRARRCRRFRAQNRCRMIDLHSHLLPGLDDGPAERGGLDRARRRGVRRRRARDGRHAAPARGLPERATSRRSPARVAALQARLNADADRARARHRRRGRRAVGAGRERRGAARRQLRRPRARPAGRDALRRAAGDVRGPAVPDPRARVPDPARAPGAQPVLPERPGAAGAARRGRRARAADGRRRSPAAGAPASSRGG